MKRFRILSCFALVLVVMTIMKMPVRAAQNSDFTINDGVLTGYSGDGVDVVIPDGVTSIGANAFENNTRIKSITIPNSVTTVGEWAFYHCINLTEISMPDSVTQMGTYAFADCTSLEKVKLSGKLTKLDWGIFAGCQSLKEITIPSSVTEISDGVFSECASLESITIPSSVTTFGNNVFESCDDLKKIVNNAKTALSLSGINGYTWYQAGSSNEITSVSTGTAVNRTDSNAFSSYEGTDYSAVYDYRFYAENNPDVVTALENDPEQLIWHFVNFGMSEGRYAKKQFNVVKYMYSLGNEDVRQAYAGNLKMIYFHYMNFGQYEGRAVSSFDAVFSPEYYLEKNPDVYDNLVSRYSSDGNIYGWALWHFYEFGMNEGRRGNTEFGVFNYMAANQDVFEQYGKDYKGATFHYLQHGDNRPITAKYDMYTLRTTRPDVIAAFGSDPYLWIMWYHNFGKTGM